MKQFSIRDVLFLFVIAALALGWYLDRRPVPQRFLLQVSEENRGWVIDTATGQVWSGLVFQSKKDDDLRTPKIVQK